MLRTSATASLKLALGLMLILSLAACGNETGTSVTPNTPPVNSAAAVVAPNAGVITNMLSPQAQIQSQGLGLSKTEWEKLHGSGILIAPGLPSFQDEKGQYQIIMADERVAQIERRWPLQPISLELAKEESKKLYPVDARFIKSLVAPANKDKVEVFFSELAKQAFAAIPNTIPLWSGGFPGNFTVTYRQSANHQIESIVIALGINPT